MNKKAKKLQTVEDSDSNLIAKYEKTIYDLKQMLEISRSLSARLELSALIESILYIAMAQMRVTGVGLFTLKNIDSSVFEMKDNYTGLSVDASVDYKFSSSSCIISKLAEIGKVCTFEELKAEVNEVSENCKEIRMLETITPSLIVPLILKNRINGVLVLGDRIILGDDAAEYDDYEREEISTIASLASIAINNASLIEQSSTDMMTHLKLKYYFFNNLTDKLDSAFAQGRDLSVLMFDIDFFKKFNDTYGHECGDYVLINVARIIKNSVREEDMASRYGGEEFTVLLNDTDKEGAVLVAERIRKNIENEDFVYNGIHMKVTISGGVSVFSTEENPVLSAKALVNQADQALYVSKENGRNCISVYSEEKSVEKVKKSPEKPAAGKKSSSSKKSKSSKSKSLKSSTKK